MQYFTFRNLVQREEKPEWLIPQLLPSTGWSLLIGEEGIGKSTLAVQLCVALEEGGEFLGQRCKETRCLYVQADSPLLEWQERVEMLAPGARVGTIVDVEADLLDSAKLMESFRRYFLENEALPRPGFVVWDSFYNLSSVNMNSEQILRPIKMIKMALGDIPFLVLHHPSKESGGGVRASGGHHALTANASQVFHLKATKLSVKKGRLMKKGDVRVQMNGEGMWELDVGGRYGVERNGSVLGKIQF